MDKLLKSLSKFQSKVMRVDLDGQVSYGNTQFRYSTLQNLITSTREDLIDNDLLITQTVEDGKLVTTLWHNSGDNLRSSVMLPECTNPQDFGKWMTYIKRYQYASILGLVSEEDDDGKVKDKAKKPANREPKKVINQMSNQQFKKCIERFNAGETDVFDKAKANGFMFSDFQLETINICEERKQRPKVEEIF